MSYEYELIDAGDRVLALVDQRMRGRSTGIGYRSQAEALEAVGLRE